jgi:Uma2 family endonuclease
VAAPADVGRPVHKGPWTLDEVLALPEDYGQRVELVDGNLVMSPLGSVKHQILAAEVFFALRTAAPADVMPTIDLNVQLSNERLLIPDFTIVKRTRAEEAIDRTGADGLALSATDVVLVGEILSPSSRTYDLVFKRELYAEAGVPYYLVVDPKGSPATAVLFELDDGRYREVARSEDGVLRLERPFPVVLDLI